MQSGLRHWMKLVEGQGQPDGDAYFDMQSHDVQETRSPKSRNTLTYMSPSDFLRMAEPGFDREKANTVAHVIKTGAKFNSLPLLSFIHDGVGTAKVIGHEGRHRARALQELGVKQIPVILKSQSSEHGRAIRWGSQDDSFDHVPVLPTVLRGETGGSITMPKSVVYKIG